MNLPETKINTQVFGDFFMSSCYCTTLKETERDYIESVKSELCAEVLWISPN
jgi:hypothetical protein